MRVTAETITDDQIRQLRNALAISRCVFEFATYRCWESRNYREQCANIWNARYGATP